MAHYDAPLQCVCNFEPPCKLNYHVLEHSQYANIIAT